MHVLKWLLLLPGCSMATEDIFGSLSLGPVGQTASLHPGHTKWTDVLDTRDTPEAVDARDTPEAVDARDIADARDTTEVRDIADARDIAVSDTLVPAAAVSALSGSWLHAALILSNYRREKRREADITVELAAMFYCLALQGILMCPSPRITTCTISSCARRTTISAES